MSKSTIVVDLGFGDAGKGSIVDFLAREGKTPPTIVRYNGGSQAAHNVITPDGKHHTFAQFGSGTLVPGVRTFLSRYMLIDVFAMLHEADHIKSLTGIDPYQFLYVDANATVISPYQKAANRLRELLRKDARHGSCGMGIGETMADNIAHPDLAIKVGDLLRPETLLSKLKAIKQLKYIEFKDRFAELDRSDSDVMDAAEIIIGDDETSPVLFANSMRILATRFKIVDLKTLKKMSEESDLIFEGAQGVLLDEWYGFHPYTTWSTTTVDNAVNLLAEIDFDGDQERLGLIRAYQTRHGAGPFPTEDPTVPLTPELHNGNGKWQGAWRVGWLDSVLTRYAIMMSPVDTLAVTNLDRFTSKERRICTHYVTKENVTIRSIPANLDEEDLVYQGQLTKMLAQLRPVYEAVDDDVSFIRMIEDFCYEIPVSIVSMGPTAADKKRRPLGL